MSTILGKGLHAAKRLYFFPKWGNVVRMCGKIWDFEIFGIIREFHFEDDFESN